MESEFESIEPFYIDDGQLDNLNKQECFVLGYELSTICFLAETNKEKIEKTVHANNLDRITSALNKRKRTYSFVWPHDDISETWIYLTIDAI